jgi:site-specific recombinase XerD
MNDPADEGVAPLVMVPPATATLVLPVEADVSLPMLTAAWAGARAAERTVEFLAANIRNPNTRKAYHQATIRFVQWCQGRGFALEQLRGVHVAGYVDELGQALAPLTVKLHLAALKHWFDSLVTGHVLENNPAHAVRGPRYSQEGGKTPVLERDQAKTLLSSIDGSTMIGARDLALLSVMLFSFARIGAVVKMKVSNYRGVGTNTPVLELHEKGGKFHRVPAHHRVVDALDAYLLMAELKDSPQAPLWQNVLGGSGKLSGKAMTARGALDIVKRRCKAAGLPADISNHSFRATGITLHQEAGGDLEAARQIAGHASVKTTQLYNRAGDMKRRAEVERVQL